MVLPFVALTVSQSSDLAPLHVQLAITVDLHNINTPCVDNSISPDRTLFTWKDEFKHLFIQ